MPLKKTDQLSEREEAAWRVKRRDGVDGSEKRLHVRCLSSDGGDVNGDPEVVNERRFSKGYATAPKMYLVASMARCVRMVWYA